MSWWTGVVKCTGRSTAPHQGQNYSKELKPPDGGDVMDGRG